MLSDEPLNNELVSNVEEVMEQMIDKIQKENKFLAQK
jgi:hypothetical protein